MQISTSVGVVQDILISLSFQKNAKLIMDPSRSQDQPAGICVNALRRNWRVAHHCGVPERVRPMCLSARLLIDKSALIAACSMRQVREAINQHFKVAIRRPVHVCPDIPRVSQGTRWKSYSSTRPQSATCAERVIRLLSPPLLVVPRSASRVSIHSPPPRCFSALVSSRRLAPEPPLGSLEMTSVFPCFCPSSY